MEIQTITSNYPENIQALAEAGHVFLCKQLKNIIVYPDPPNLIAYGYAKTYKDTICTLILSKNEIKMGFYKGSELEDPTSLLTGSGKVHKYVTIQKTSDLKNPHLKVLINKAVLAWKTRRS